VVTKENEAPAGTAPVADEQVLDTAPPVEVAPVAEAPARPPWVMPPFVVKEKTAAAAVRVRRRRAFEVLLLLLVSAGLYAYAGWWLKYDYHFHIGDALARTLDAKLTLWSRDPHMAAIGVYWMPLPTFAQVPLMAFLQPLGHPDYAGPLSSALFAAGTVAVIAKAGRDLGLNRLSALLAAAAYGVNPVVVYYAANGMSESCEFFFLAVSLWGLLRYLRDSRAGSALLSGVGLAFLALSKYEAVPVVMVIVAAVLLVFLPRIRRDRNAAALDVSLFALPPILAYVFWLTYNKLILGSWLAFLHVADATQGAGGEATAAAGTPPTTPTPVVQCVGNGAHDGSVQAAKCSLPGTADFLLHNLLAFGPVLLLLVPLLLLSSRWRRSVGGLAILGAGLASVAATTYLAYKGGTFGNPRYYTPLIPVSAVAVVWVAGRVRRWGQLLVTPLMIGAFALTAVTGTIFEENARGSAEYETRVFALAQGRYDHITSLGGLASVPEFQQLADRTDALLQPGQHVLVDTRFNGTVMLLADKSRQFIVNADRDYQSITDPGGGTVRIEYAVVTAPNSTTFLGQANDDAFKMVSREQGSWTMLYGNSVAQIWRRSDAANVGLRPPVV